MSKPHKHRDAIIAWANGEEIEFSYQGSKWLDYSEECGMFNDNIDYRIKPKIVKREGWVNVYPSISYAAYVGYVFKTKEAADRNEDADRQACIRIEWEEKV